MKTVLSPEKLAELHVEGRARDAAGGRFVDPTVVNCGLRVLQIRGEEWASSVLMRPLTRRSLLSPAYPWFNDGELDTLILADHAELTALFD